MGRPAGWMKKLTERAVMRSRGAPSHRREVARQVWQQIATGITSERAAEAVGVSQPVGTRWFRHRGGMPLFMSKPVTARCLSFAEREEIAHVRAQDVGRRETGNSSPLRAKPINSVARTAPQCRISWRQARISGVGRAVEVRAGGQKAQARQAGGEPTSAPVCPRSPGGKDPRCPRAPDCRALAGSVHRPQQAASW